MLKKKKQTPPRLILSTNLDLFNYITSQLRLIQLNRTCPITQEAYQILCFGLYSTSTAHRLIVATTLLWISLSNILNHNCFLLFCIHLFDNMSDNYYNTMHLMIRYKNNISRHSKGSQIKEKVCHRANSIDLNSLLI